MIGLEPVIELVNIALWSGQLQGERPVSLILVAPPGSGKTSVLEMLECPCAQFLSDLTSREIKYVLRKNKDTTHIMLGDFLAVFGRAKGTVKLTVNLLARLTGDKVTHEPWTGEEIEPKQMGFISAIPPDDLNRREVKNFFNTGGFASRFLIAKYDYSVESKERVHKYIREGRYRKKKPFIMQMKNDPKIVNIPAEISKEIDHLSRMVARDPLGFRAHHYLRTLACAVARKSDRSVVNETDVEKITELAQFFMEKGKII